MADEASDDRLVLLLNPRLVVLAVGPGTGELYATLTAVLGEGCVDDHVVVILVNAADEEGQLPPDGLQSCNH